MTEKMASVPMKSVGPIAFTGPLINEHLKVPMATFETPLWASTNRGAKVSRLSNGLDVHCISDCMTRSILVEAKSVGDIANVISALELQPDDIDTQIQSTSRFAKLDKLTFHPVGRQLYIRIQIKTGDASGHNMATKAAQQVLNWILEKYPVLKYVSLSGNACSDKKVSGINGILGRGKYIIADCTISRDVVIKHLRSTPEKIAEINTKKNLLGSHVAGSIRSANAHYANMLLGCFLATGQDAANIIEGSQGFTTAEVTESGDLYFAVTIPNLIVGTVGNGKHLPWVKDNLEALGCTQDAAPGSNAKRLAAVCAGACWCCELSLLAALTNPEELMRAHTLLERQKEA